MERVRGGGWGWGGEETLFQLRVADSSGESESSEDSDIDGEATSALFMVVRAIYLYALKATLLLVLF